MNILIVSQYFWPEEFAINTLAQSLHKKGHIVEVLTGNPNYPEGRVYNGRKAWFCGKEQWQGIMIHRVPLIPRGSGSGIMLAINYLSFFLSGILLGLWILRGRKYDVIFTCGYSPPFPSLAASLIGWIKHCPVALWVQDLWPESLKATGYVSSGFVLLVMKQVVRFLYQRTDLLMIQSKGFGAPVAKLSENIPIEYYPNSVDDLFFTPKAMVLPSIPALDKGFSVLFAGNTGTAQAVEVIIEAADLLRDEAGIQFVVLGNGSRWEWMKEQVSTREMKNLHLEGRFPSDTMPGLMRKASALLVTLTDDEIFALTIPNKVQAYLATGVPVIACLNGEGARIVTEAGAGLAVPAQDAKALASAVYELKAMSEGERKAMGERGRAYFKEHFDHDLLVNRLIQILSNLSQCYKSGVKPAIIAGSGSASTPNVREVTSPI
jgi:glycosyltransferase involved in cell wall biosynthesis